VSGVSWPSWVPEWFKEKEHLSTLPYCWIYKGAVKDPKMHRNRNGIPACGTRVDVCALEYETDIGDNFGDPCRRCFPEMEGRR